MSNIVPLHPGGTPAAFANRPVINMNAAAQANVSAGFGVVGYKGKNWRFKYRGDDELLQGSPGTDHSGNALPVMPLPQLPVVIVGISPNISKIWYDKKYAEGDDVAPDCWSTNGTSPDPASPKPQCATCAACPKNVWGSRVSEAGKKGKACQDSRRIAVVPSWDIENEPYGGPMLLRVPPMSIGNLDRYSRELAKFGAQPYWVTTLLSFNHDVAYPEIQFAHAGYLAEEQAGELLVTYGEDLSDERIARILSQTVVEVQAAPEPVAPAAPAGAPPAAFARPALPAPTPTPAPAPTPTPVQQQPAPAPVAAQPAVAVPTPSRKKAPPFVAPAGAAAAPQAAAPKAAAQAAPPIVQKAPADMESAIDALLGS